MAKTSITVRMESLQTDVRQQRHLIHVQMEQIEKQQAVLDVQFQRIAHIQAELDLVKATVRLAAPTYAASLIGRSPHPSSAASPEAHAPARQP
jgi:hypothetical protein